MLFSFLVKPKLSEHQCRKDIIVFQLISLTKDTNKSFNKYRKVFDLGFNFLFGRYLKECGLPSKEEANDEDMIVTADFVSTMELLKMICIEDRNVSATFCFKRRWLGLTFTSGYLTLGNYRFQLVDC